MLQLYHRGQFLLMKEAEYQGKPTELNIFYLLKILTIIFGNILNIHVFTGFTSLIGIKLVLVSH
jgi:hypothetical protein